MSMQAPHGRAVSHLTFFLRQARHENVRRFLFRICAISSVPGDAVESLASAAWLYMTNHLVSRIRISTAYRNGDSLECTVQAYLHVSRMFREHRGNEARLRVQVQVHLQSQYGLFLSSND